MNNPTPKREELRVEQRRAILVAVVPPKDANKEHVLDELKGLVQTAGVVVVGTLVQTRERPHVATFLGSGKLEQLKLMVEALNADLICFDNALSPSQGKNLENATNTIIVDRSEVILHIFATRARTYEARLQVELAQLLYFRPRLKRMWTHLERIEGGIGTGRGPGEKQLEVDRRLVDRRIAELKRKLKDVEKRRERLVASRGDTPTVSLVGYTNAGKSTLMNALTDADVLVADKLFATLDTRTRKWTLPHWGEVLLSDTVGFVRDLPHHLVASFKSTLEEARHADLLLHVVDASDPNAEAQIRTVNRVLSEIEVDHENSVLVLNKIDAVQDHSIVDVLRAKHKDCVTVSATTGQGLDRLTESVGSLLGGGFVEADVETSVGNGRLLHFLREHADVRETEYGNDSRVTLRCRMAQKFADQISGDDTTITLVHADSPASTPLNDPALSRRFGNEQTFDSP